MLAQSVRALKGPCDVRGSHPADFTAGEVTQETRGCSRLDNRNFAHCLRWPRRNRRVRRCAPDLSEASQVASRGTQAGLIGLVIGGRQDERKSRGAAVKKGQLRA